MLIFLPCLVNAITVSLNIDSFVELSDRTTSKSTATESLKRKESSRSLEAGSSGRVHKVRFATTVVTGHVSLEAYDFKRMI